MSSSLTSDTLKIKKNMKDKFLEDYAINFIKKHFDEINFEILDWKINSIEDAIEEIKNNSYMPTWIITEVMDWGTPINYLKELIVEHDNYFIIKIEEKYFKYNHLNEQFFEVFPKIVLVEKLIFE